MSVANTKKKSRILSTGLIDPVREKQRLIFLRNLPRIITEFLLWQEHLAFLSNGVDEVRIYNRALTPALPREIFVLGESPQSGISRGESNASTTWPVNQFMEVQPP